MWLQVMWSGRPQQFHTVPLCLLGAHRESKRNNPTACDIIPAALGFTHCWLGKWRMIVCKLGFSNIFNEEAFWEICNVEPHLESTQPRLLNLKVRINRCCFILPLCVCSKSQNNLEIKLLNYSVNVNSIKSLWISWFSIQNAYYRQLF